jgi:hypothetical protein
MSLSSLAELLWPSARHSISCERNLAATVQRRNITPAFCAVGNYLLATPYVPLFISRNVASNFHLVLLPMVNGWGQSEQEDWQYEDEYCDYAAHANLRRVYETQV